MKKKLNFLILLLVTALLLPMFPSVPVYAESGSGIEVYTETETESATETEPETEPEIETEPETEPEIETEPETEPETEEPADPVEIREIQWRNGKNNSDAFSTLVDNSILFCNEILFRLTLSEKADSVRVTVNGEALDTTVMLNYVFVTAEVINGAHSLEVEVVKDGVTTAYSAVFNVYGDASYPTVDMEIPAEILLGETNTVYLTCDNLEDLATLLMNVEIDRSYKVVNVELADGIVGMYMWYRGVLKIEARILDASKVTNDIVATISLKAPVHTEDGDLAMKVTSAKVVTAAGSSFGNSGNFVGGFMLPLPTVGIAYAYTVESVGEAIKGAEHTLLVKGYDKAPAAGVCVYALVDGQKVLLGTTNEEGLLVTRYFDTLDTYEIYAEANSGAQSETATVECITPVGNSDGTPYGVTFNAPVFNGKSFSWMSHYLGSAGQAVLRISTVSSMSNAVEIIGTSSVVYYNDGTKINRINTAAVTDLAPGFTYYYQIGDGTVWSEVASFTVGTSDETSVSFAVLGGTLGATANLDLVYDAIRNGKPQLITPQAIRRRIEVMQEAYRQNGIPFPEAK